MLVVFFWSPLHKLVGALPDALANSDTLTVGSVSLRIGKKLSAQANQDVRDALSGMFANDITLVVQNELGGSLTYSAEVPSATLDSWERLEKLGVVVRLSDEELTKIATEHNQPKVRFAGRVANYEISLVAQG